MNRMSWLAIGICLLGALQAQAAQPGAQYQLNVPAQSVYDALKAFAAQTNLQVVYYSDVAQGAASPGVSGEWKADEALKRILAGTGLTFQFLNERTVAIRVERDAAAGVAPSDRNATDERLQLARAAGGSAMSEDTRPTSVAADGESSSAAVSEIVVTAQKREERMRDVPIPVTALSGDKLAVDNQLLLRDYYSSVPGLNVAPGLYEQMGLSIRGVTTGNGNPTVGVMVDEASFGGSTQGTQGGLVPNIDPGDLARVEVLRGPQGTLYGANSLGGLLKFVTRDPTSDRFSGRVEAGTSSVRHGDQPGFNIRGSFNVPVTETLAIRVSGFRRQDPGYIDNPLLTEKGLNDAQAEGARLSALWKPSDAFSVKLSALYQKTEVNDTAEVYDLPGLGELEHNSVPGVGGDTRTVQAFSAVLKGRVGTVDLTSITAYSENKDVNSLDYSHVLGGLVQQQYGVSGTAFFNWLNTRKFTQEVRAVVPVGTRFEWLIGGYYTDEDTPGYETQPALDRTTGRFVAEAIAFDFPRKFKEYAAFTNLTYRFSERFDVQVGGRQSRLKESDLPTQVNGPFTLFYYGQPSPVTTPGVHSENDAFTYLLTPRLKLTPDWMVYARIASGYRPGGPNMSGIGAPAQYEPDKTRNYEMGVKGELLDRAVSVEASVYSIDWTNLQIQLINPQGFAYTANASEARSQGAELAVTARPLGGLTIEGWVAFNDAALTQHFPADSQVHGANGDRLPFSSRLSANLSIQQDFPLPGGVTGFAGASGSFVGDRVGAFSGTAAATAPRQKYPSYTKADLRAGVRYESWTANLFINNVTDERGVLNGGIGYFYPFAYQYITPRTVGLSVSKSF